MNLDYYVIPHYEQFQVLREGGRKGVHPNRERAIEAACFMASIETEALGIPVDVFVQDEHGGLSLFATYRPQNAASPQSSSAQPVMPVAA